MHTKFTQVGHYLWGSCKKFYARIKFIYSEMLEKNDCFNIAASLTYTTLLSLVPLIAVGVGILSSVPIVQEYADKVKDLALTIFVPTSRDVVSDYLTLFSQKTRELTIFGMLFLIITAILLIAKIEEAFNIIWHVPKRRNLLLAIVLYWALITLGPIFMGLGFAITSYAESLNLSAKAPQELTIIYQNLLFLSPVVLSWLTFVLVYTLIPNTKVPLKFAISGGLIAAILFEIAKKCFVLYITEFKNYQILYGTLATIPIFLIWIYLSWIITLIGAAITYTLSLPFLFPQDRIANDFLQALDLLRHLHKAQCNGKSLSLQELQRYAREYHDQNLLYNLETMVKHDIVKVTDKYNYMLSRDVSKFTVLDLYNITNWQLPSLRELDAHKLNKKMKNLYLRIKKIDQAIDDNLNISLLEAFE